MQKCNENLLLRKAEKTDALCMMMSRSMREVPTTFLKFAANTCTVSDLSTSQILWETLVQMKQQHWDLGKSNSLNLHRAAKRPLEKLQTEFARNRGAELCNDDVGECVDDEKCTTTES